jgi:RHH-type proline utilization regulon transcriptional repressor/proline dehydrogenase/delta 1-pyrroline-5-carboxylate dehydrogenase
MDAADRARDQHEKASRKRVARLMRNPAAIEATITMTDEVMRITEVKSASRIFRSAAHKASIKGFGPINGIGLKVLGLISFVLPRTSVKMVNQRVRALSSDLILTSENRKLAKHLAARKEIGIALNINVLGEAVLGDYEATRRLDSILEMMSRAEVNYVSVKLSAVVAQLTIIDFAGSVNRVSEKMRVLYRAAQVEITLLRQITTLIGAKIEITNSIKCVSGEYARVRWLALSLPPTLELMKQGISIDFRPIAQRGDIEAPRWL